MLWIVLNSCYCSVQVQGIANGAQHCCPLWDFLCIKVGLECGIPACTRFTTSCGDERIVCGSERVSRFILSMFGFTLCVVFMCGRCLCIQVGLRYIVAIQHC